MTNSFLYNINLYLTCLQILFIEIAIAEAKKQAETLEDAAKTYFNTQIASYEGHRCRMYVGHVRYRLFTRN